MDRNALVELGKKGFKLTSQRKAIIELLSSSEECLTPADIFERLRKCYPNIGLVTVYRTLEMLERCGLLCEMHIGESCGSYLRKKSDVHHHHLVCTDCGRVVDFSGCGMSELEKRLSDETGFQIESHLLEFIGRCRACRQKKEYME